VSDRKSEGSLQLWKTLRLIIFIVGVILAARMIFVRPLQTVANKAEAQLDKVLESLTGHETKIVAGKGVLESRKEVAELAMIELKMNTVRSLENESFVAKYVSLGRKRLELQGVFRVKVGYDLNQGCEIYENEGGRVMVKFPRARILSVELLELRTLHEEEGWLNKVNPKDRDSLVNELREQMKDEAEDSGLLEYSESHLRTRLKDLLGVQSGQLEFEQL